MPETKTLADIRYITDFETPIYSLGEVEGSFDPDTLEDYIDKYGSTGLYQHMAYLQYQIVETQRRINARRYPSEDIGDVVTTELV